MFANTATQLCFRQGCPIQTKKYHSGQPDSEQTDKSWNKIQHSSAGAGAWAELGNIVDCL